ncbi:nucleoside phosphorylase [Thermoanaerobacterium saccharolyticum]|uniref:5'-methylthioadenosine/S-adenosylhomocysteine nucleosidase family protein n=1 Tax=Thermoanaerobacterium saccharolyticum TaxID=28896 RepID=UPI002FD8A164
MVYISVSMYVEAKPIIDYYNLKKDVDERFYQIFKSDNMRLIITGVGKVNCAAATSHLLAKIPPGDGDIVVNIGVCGAKDGFQIGTPYLINKIKDASTGKDYYTDVLLKHDFKECSIETFDKPLFNQDFLEEDMCDMESSGFYISASKYVEQHRIFLIKVVSDRVGIDTVSKDDVLQFIQNNIEKIDDFIKNAEDFAKVDDSFFKKEELVLIEKICSLLKLTKSFREILYKSCLHYKVRTGKDILFLENIELLDVNNKRERKKYLDLIISSLEENA